MEKLRLVVRFDTVDEFLGAFDREIAQGGLIVRQRGVAPDARDCDLEVQVVQRSVSVRAHVVAVRPTAVAVAFDGVPAALSVLAQAYRSLGDASQPGAPATSAATQPEDRPETALDEPAAPGPPEPAPASPPQAGSFADRVAALPLAQKIQLALSGDRDARIVLLRDQQKPLHAHVLRNPRITLEEVAFAARLPSLAPDALKLIAGHRDWTRDPGICTALVRNHATPVPVAVQLLTRVPIQELKALARGGGRPALVQAARKLVLLAP